MNAKQRKQAEKIAAYAKAISDKHVEFAMKKMEELAVLIAKQEALQADLDMPALIAQRARLNHEMEIEFHNLSRCRTLIQMERDLDSARDAVERDRNLANARHDDVDIRLLKFQNEVRLREGDLAYRKMKLDKANLPILEVLQNILIQLELEQDPQAIAEEIRKTYGIMEAKW